MLAIISIVGFYDVWYHLHVIQIIFETGALYVAQASLKIIVFHSLPSLSAGITGLRHSTHVNRI